MPPSTTRDALLVVAAFSRHAALLEQARARLADLFGPVAFAGEPYSFHHTDYYTRSMGHGLLKQLIVFEQLVPLDGLADHKRVAIDLERELKAGGDYDE